MTALLAVAILVPLLGAALSIGLGRSRRAQRVVGVVALGVVAVASVVLLVRGPADRWLARYARESEAEVDPVLRPALRTWAAWTQAVFDVDLTILEFPVLQ